MGITYIVRIHSSRSATPIDTLDYWRQQKHYAANSYIFSRSAVGTVSQAYMKRIFSVLDCSRQDTAIA